ERLPDCARSGSRLWAERPDPEYTCWCGSAPTGDGQML
ncbi:MAG: hypothetical protein AVDCRST_MAG43-334, partial [uncultured Thermomicrobiales bacterium]